MPDPGSSARWSASQASRCSAVRSRTTPRRSDSRSSEPRSTRRRASRAELLGDVGGDPRVGGGGGRQHRDAVGQLGQQGAQPAVVGPEVVPPVGDAVRLVDDEQPGRRGQPGQHLVAEAGVVEPLRATPAARRPRPAAMSSWTCCHCSMLVELMVTARMPARSAAAIWLRISASSGEMITVGPAPRPAQQGGGDEVDRRLAPAGALDDEGPAPVDDQRLDRRPLVVAEPGVVVPHERAQVLLGGGAEGGRVGERHATGLPAATDGAAAGRRARRCSPPPAGRS